MSGKNWFGFDLVPYARRLIEANGTRYSIKVDPRNRMVLQDGVSGLSIYVDGKNEHDVDRVWQFFGPIAARAGVDTIRTYSIDPEGYPPADDFRPTLLEALVHAACCAMEARNRNG